VAKFLHTCRDEVPELAGRVRTARAQMLATTPASRRLGRPVYARWGYDYWQQLPDGRVALGGARDRGGDAEWIDEAVPTAAVQSELDRLLEGLGIDGGVTHRWAGTIAFAEERLPVVEEVRPGVVACGAYSGTGNLLGPLAGRAAVEIAVDGASDLADVLSGR
jgi:gamma-glutamylputrescine oxidase